MGTMSLRVVSSTGAPVAPECRVPASRETARTDVRIDGWLVQPSLNMLTRDDMHVRLRPQLMDVLMCLAGKPGSVFTPDELVAVVWDGRWIAPSGISRCIAELRSALRDDARTPHVIETITKRGYRLIAPVQPAGPRGASTDLPSASPGLTVAGSGLQPGTATPADRKPEGERHLLWRRIERAVRFLSWGPPARAFRS